MGKTNCPNPNDSNFKKLANIIGNDEAYAIWDHNVSNGETGPIEEGKGAALIQGLINKGIALDEAQAIQFLAIAYTSEVKEELGLSFAKDITLAQLLEVAKDKIDVYKHMTTAQVAEVRDAFVYALVQDVETLEDIAKIKLENIDAFLDQLERDTLLIDMVVAQKEGVITEESLSEYFPNEASMNKYLAIREKLKGKSVEELNILANTKENRLNLVKQNKEFFTNEAKKVLAQLNISYKEAHSEDLSEEESDGESEDAMSSGTVNRPHFESSVKENASAAIKIFFATIPKVTEYKNGVFTYDTDTFLGTTRLDPNIFNFVLVSAHNITQIKDEHGNIQDPIDNLIKILEAKAPYKPSLFKVIEKLKESPKSLHAQLYDVVSKHKAAPLDTLITKQDNSKAYKEYNALLGKENKIKEKIAKLEEEARKAPTDKVFLDLEKAHAELAEVIDEQFVLRNQGSVSRTSFSVAISKGDALINGYQLARVWESEFNRKFTKPDSSIYDKAAYNTFYQSYLESGILTAIEKAAIAEDRTKVYEFAVYALEPFGIEVDINAVGLFINSLEGANFQEQVDTFRARLGGMLKSFKNTINSTASIKDSLYSKDSFIKELSDVAHQLSGSAGELTYRGAKGNKQYLIQNHNMITSVIARAASGDVSYFESMAQGVMQKFSVLMAKFKKDPTFFSKLQVFSYGNNKVLNSKDKGSKASDLKAVDQYSDVVTKYLSGYWVGLAEADKTMQYYLGDNMDVYESEVIFNEPTSGTDIVEVSMPENSKFKKVLKHYLKAEISRIRYEHNRLHNPDKSKRLALRDQIQHLHYSKERGDNKGNYDKFVYFEGLTIDILKNEYDIDILDATFDLSDLDIENLKLHNFFEGIANSIINADLQAGVEAGAIKKQGRNVVNQAIPNEIMAKFDNDLFKTIGAFSLTSLVANFEMSLLFTTDVANFKSKGVTVVTANGEEISMPSPWVDYQKRVPVFTSPGREGYIYEDDLVKIKPTYTSATIKDFKVGSSVITKENLDKTAENIHELLGKDSPGLSTIKGDLSAYVSGIDLADAQAYITLDLWKQRYASHYGWNQAMEESYQRLSNGTFTAEDYKVITTVPLKTTHAEVLFDPAHPNTPLIQFNKQSEAVLIPSMVKGTHLEQVLTLMESNGVEHLIMESGKKAGAIGLVDIVNPDGSINLDADLRSVDLDTRHAYLQMDVKSKGKKEIGVSSQMHKNLLAMAEKGEFDNFATGGKYTAEQVRSLLEETISTMSNMELDKMLSDITDDYGLVDSIKFGKLITTLFKGEISDASENRISKGESLETVLEAKDKLAPKLMAFIKKAVITLKNFGGVGVQTSSLGITGVQGKLTAEVLGAIKWFKDSSERLRAMELVDEGNGKYKSKKAQILISHDYLQKIFENVNIDWNKLSGEDLAKMLAPELLHGIMYRTPNQGASSNDVFEIVGILPSGMGDTIIAYDEVTAKTGSDFDIDKMFMLLAKPRPIWESSKGLFPYVFNGMTNNLKMESVDVKNIHDKLVKGERLEAIGDLTTLYPNISIDAFENEAQKLKVKFFKKNPIQSYRVDKPVSEMSKEELQQLRLDTYVSIMTNPQNYLEIMKPLDTPWLSDLYKKVKIPNTTKKIGVTTLLASPLKHLTGSNQMTTKRVFDNAKALVGIVANHFSHQNLLKSENVGFKGYNLGIGVDKSGTTRFNHSIDESGNSISETFIGYMNAIVDAAKDPFITLMNINSFTASTAFMLARAGVDREWISMFMKQPILEQYVNLLNRTEGNLADNSESAVLQILSMYGAESRVIDNVPNLKNTEGRITLSKEKLTQNILDTINNKPLPNDEQLRIFSQFLEWQEYAKDLDLLIKVNKVDVNGAGKNFNSARVLYSQLIDILEGNTKLDPKGVSELMGIRYNKDSGELEYITNQQTIENTVIETSVEKIYSQLGNKTQSKNVVIDNVAGRKPAVESNINLTKKNLFTVKPIQSADKKAITKASIATQYIGFAEGIEGSSTENYRQQILAKTSKLFDPKDKSLKRGSVVEYNGKKYLFWNNNNGKAQLINTDGTKFSGTPNLDKLVVIGSYKTSIYNKTEYIVTDNDNVYSGATGKLVYTGKDNSSKVQKEKIIASAKKDLKSDIVNSGNYSSNDVIFVSIGGKRGNETIRKEQQDKTIREALKAIEAGATLITDNKTYVESSDYNEGEKRLAKNLEAKGYNYSEQTIDGQALGVWSKNQSSKPIVAYRTRGNNFLEALEKDNAIGNPWSHAGYSLYKTNTVKEAVEEFIAWMIGEKHTDKLQDYRQAIINKIPEMKGKTILYYKDLGEPSHATALDYLINEYDWNLDSITISESTISKKQPLKHLGALFMNSVGLVVDTLGTNLILEGSDTVFKTVEHTIRNLGKKISNEELVDKLTRDVASSIRGNYEGLSGNAVQDLATVYDFLKADNNAEFVKSNFLLSSVIKPSLMYVDGKPIKTIKTVTNNVDVTVLEYLFKSFEEVFNYNPDFSETLARSLFHLSGYTTSTNNVYKYIHESILDRMGYNRYINGVMQSDNSSILDNELEMVIKNNSEDSKIVPEVPSKSFPSTAIGIHWGIAKVSLTYMKSKNFFYNDIEGNKVFPSYITTTSKIQDETGAVVSGPSYLMKYIGISSVNPDSAMYVRVNKLGVDVRGETIKEYFNQTEALKRVSPIIKALKSEQLSTKSSTVEEVPGGFRGKITRTNGTTVYTAIYADSDIAIKATEDLAGVTEYSPDQIAYVLDLIGHFSAFESNNIVTPSEKLDPRFKLFVDKVLSLRNTTSDNIVTGFNSANKMITVEQVEDYIKKCM